MENKLEMINTTALAYLGDAVFETEVRKHVMCHGEVHVDMLHRSAIKYVSAEGQAKVLKKLMREVLTEEELKLAKRARNRKICSKPKNVEPGTYKLATAFEALMGFLYLKNEQNRLYELINLAFKIIEEGEILE